MSEGLFSMLSTAGIETPRAGYRLDRLEVFNWGTFDGRVWRLSPSGHTSLLTGDIGSGKSTLVDALTTLLLPAHRISYNKAAGAEAKERSLRSYVLGHYKSERVESSGSSRPIGLRDNGTSYSVILGVFHNDGHDETVTLAQVFQQRERTGQPYRFFVTAPHALTIAEDFADFGDTLPDLRKRLRSNGSQIFDDYPKYATSLRRLLGIRSAQALDLFHQTVSMKSVGNLNEFVRNHMLEPSDASDRVRDIIGHFDDLTKAHDAVKRAREQLDALGPVVTTAAKYDQTLAAREETERQHRAVRLYIAELRIRLLDDEIKALGEIAAQVATERDTARAAAQRLSDRREALLEERASAGGDRLGELERLTRQARDEADQRRGRKAAFDQDLVLAGFGRVDDEATFVQLGKDIPLWSDRARDRRRALDNDVAEANQHKRDWTAARTAAESELASLQQRTSNLPAAQAELRDRLCADLGLSRNDLPFAGELLDVAEQHAEWRGAAERVLRGFALSLLVAQDHYDRVSDWINGRRLTFRGRDGKPVGARLVYERVSNRRVPLQRRSDDGLLLADCLEIKDGRFADYLADELTNRADHRCVDTMAEFRRTRRAVTRAGQVRSGDRHEKDDRRRIDDPLTWVLGWANERKIGALTDQIAELTTEIEAVDVELDRIHAERERVAHTEQSLARLTGHRSWLDLDHEEASSRAEAHEAERIRLVGGASRLAEIEQQLDRTKTEADELAGTIEELTERLGIVKSSLTNRQTERNGAAMTVSESTDDEVARARESYEILTEQLGRSLPTQSGECAAASDRLTGELHTRSERLGKELQGHGLQLGQAMNAVLQQWPELRADLDASVDARADFVALQERVRGDDLPRFESEFKTQLNTNTIRELAQFNNWLRRQADDIDDRIARINEALDAIPYNPGRYIRLEKQRTDNSDVAAFRKDLRDATDDTLSPDDDHYSEQRFVDVRRIIERFRGREGYGDADRTWTRRVTDVRNWFVFSASERDKGTGQEWEHYSDSDGKSGGQKEKLAYTILAASLAYQFGLEWGVAASKDFRFAVIDEAFGRGSDVSTRYALDLFAKLGLQLLIVTPLQKVHIIEPYVQAIGFVDNPFGSGSRLQTMTIEEYRERRDGPPQ